MSATTTVDTTTASGQALQELIDREAIVRLVQRLGVMLDDQDFDLVPTIFTPDASIATPGGRTQGGEAIAAQARRNHRPGIRTQHRVTDVVVDLDGDRASVRGNYVGTFAVTDQPVGPGEAAFNPAPQFQIGSVYRFEAVRTADGWRLQSMEMHPVWEVGERP